VARYGERVYGNLRIAEVRGSKTRHKNSCTAANTVKILLRNFAKGRSEAMGDMSDLVAKLGDHIVDHFTNEKIVLDDENARRVLRLVGHLSVHAPNEPSANCLLGSRPMEREYTN